MIMIKLKLSEGVVGFDHVVDSHSTHIVKLPRQGLLVMVSTFVDSHRMHSESAKERLTSDGLIFYGYFLHGCFEERVHTACILVDLVPLASERVNDLAPNVGQDLGSHQGGTSKDLRTV